MIILVTAGAGGGFAQSSAKPGGVDRTTLMKEFTIPEEKADTALELVNDLIATLYSSSRRMATLLSQQNPDQLFDPQVSARIDQIRKTFSLKLERFHLDFLDLVGEGKATEIVTRFRSIVPSVLLEQPVSGAGGAVASHPAPVPSADPAATPPGTAAHGIAQPGGTPGASGDQAVTSKPLEVPLPVEVPLGSTPIGPSSPSLDLSITGPSGGGSPGGMAGGMMGMMDMMKGGMGGMSGMSGASGAGTPSLDAQTAEQVLASNAAIVRLLSSLVSQPGGLTGANLELVTRLLENQSALLKVLSAGSSPGTGTTSGGGMGGMGGMGDM